MRIIAILLLITSTLVLAAPQSSESENPLAALNWSYGPKTENVLGLATIGTRKSQGFLNSTETEKFLKLSGNLPNKNENLILSFKEGNQWWTVFGFEESGYVKDDEKIDPDAILQNLKSMEEEANEERVGMGLKKLYTLGWHTPPHYDRQTNRLEWGIRIQEEGGPENLNYSIRILGRKGVMHVTLVSDAASLESDLRDLRPILASFSFDSGQKYAEYREGDKVAEYGLAALVAGGAAAVAAKKGLFGALAGFMAAAWKFVVAGLAASGKAILALIVGFFGWIASLFKKKQ